MYCHQPLPLPSLTLVRLQDTPDRPLVRFSHFHSRIDRNLYISFHDPMTPWSLCGGLKPIESA
jgi:hypothetical protein